MINRSIKYQRLITHLAAIDAVLLFGVLGAPSCASNVFSVWYKGRTLIPALWCIHRSRHKHTHTHTHIPS